MNSDKPGHNTGRKGNVVIYILIALALLGLLTANLTSQGDQASGEDLDTEKAELLTTKTVAYAASSKHVVDQMMMSGTSLANLNYVRPNHVSFDTAPHHNKVFHPDGGGLGLPAGDDNLFTHVGVTPPAGWYMGRFNNFEWTPTAANDIVLAAFGISEEVCARINHKITGTTTIPVLTAGVNSAAYFVDFSITAVVNANVTAVLCPACNGYPSLCVADNAGTTWTYYNIISGQ